MSTQFIKDNSIALIGVGIVAAGMFMSNSSGKFQSMQQTSQLVQQQRQADSQQQIQLRLSQAQAKQSAEMANARYQSGCVMVVATNSPSDFTTLTQGQPVIDRVRNVPLPDNTVVCDANGNTGEIIGGVVDRMAFTGDRSIVDAAMQRTGGLYRTPAQ